MSLNALVHSHRSKTLRVGMRLGLRIRSESRALKASCHLFSLVDNSLAICLNSVRIILRH